MAKESGEKWFCFSFFFLVISEISVQSHLVFSFGAFIELKHYIQEIRNSRVTHLIEAGK